MNLCVIEVCDGKVFGHGWCQRHYTRWRRHGDPLGGQPIYNSTEERFWAKVDKRDDEACWEWLAWRFQGGYGYFRANGRMNYAHKFAYELLKGRVATGFELDHLCRNPACVNPSHLEVVTHRENVLRGVAPAARHAKATHCPKGHAYDLLNTYYKPKGNRQCRKCRKEGVKRIYYRKKALLEA